MDYKDVLKLIDAGFTKSEICEMNKNTNNKEDLLLPQNETPSEKMATPVSIEEKSTDAPIVEPSKQENDLLEVVNSLKQEVASLRSNLQHQAINQAEQPARESVDDILKNLIK